MSEFRLREWLRSLLPERSRTRPRLQAEIEWWRSRIEYLRVSANGAPAANCAITILNAASFWLAAPAWTQSMQPMWKKIILVDATSSTLVPLRLLMQVRICEVDLISEAALKLRKDTILQDVVARVPDWRGKAIQRLLAGERQSSLETDNNDEPSESNISDGEYRSRLQEAIRIQGDYELHLYERKLLIRDHLKIIWWSMAVLLLLTAFALAMMDFQDIRLDDTLTGGGRWEVLVPLICAFAGGIGACLSALISMTSPKYNPDNSTSRVVTWCRPLIGIAAGLVVFIFVLAGILPVDRSIPAAIALAVAVGFSERLFLGTMAQADPGQQFTTVA